MKWLKKWWFSILMWVVACLVYTIMFLWLNTDKELYMLGACLCSYAVLGIMFVVIGIANAPENPKNKYKQFKDFLEWYESQKEKELNKDDNDFFKGHKWGE